MIIPVSGHDPSLTHWGTAEGNLCLDTGILTDVTVSMAVTAKGKNKQVRTNSDDLKRAEELARHVYDVGMRTEVSFVEFPVGSQSASAMKSYGAAIGIGGYMRTSGILVIEVQAKASKKALTGNPNASKADMIAAAMELYPDAGWKYHHGKLTNDNEHMADAIAAIYAGVNTPEFQDLMKLLQKVHRNADPAVETKSPSCRPAVRTGTYEPSRR